MKRTALISTILIASAILASALLAQTGGLIATDLVVGTGKQARSGMEVEVHYTGWIYQDGKKGAKFDSSLNRGEPFVFQLGQGEVIKGWDQGVVGMKEGGTRQLIIPPQLAYGQRGAAGLIPPNATLLFEVKLLRCR